MSSTLHTSSGDNRNPLIRARGELTARLAALTAERATSLSASVDEIVGWRSGTPGEQRRASVRQAAERLVEIDTAIATTTAQIAAADELLAAFDTALEG